MSTELTGSITGMHNPLYAEGMAYLQSGQWEEAIRCFESLARQHPDDPALARALEEARFRAKLDASARVRPKRFIFPWRKAIVRVAILALLAVVVVQGVQFLNQFVGNVIEPQRQERARLALFSDAQEYLINERYDEAEAALNRLLAADPDYPGAAALRPLITDGRARLALYERGIALQEDGQLSAAQQLFAELQARWPDYQSRDVQARQAQMADLQEVGLLFAEARASFELGRCQEAVGKLETLRGRNYNFQREQVEQMLADCYLALGAAIVALNPPDLAQLPAALARFEQTLALRPRDPEAVMQRDQVNRFLQGKAHLDEGRAERAIPLLRAVYDVNPRYLGGLLTSLLYDAYVANGDRLRDAGDNGAAYEQYRWACFELPVADRTLACARFTIAQTLATPTDTPTATPTVTPTGTPTVTPRPSATATPTPTPIPCSVLVQRYQGKILFYAKSPGRTGWWVMDPDGRNRVFLGDDQQIKACHATLRERETFSPDGTCRVYTTKTGEDEFPQVYAQCQPQFDLAPPTWRISQGLNRTSYDPVWSPDGSRIAFVSQTKGSDDIWVARAKDGTDQWNLTPNDWEWDKHPSWGPDSRMIVFWSNREGTPQIFIIDADDMRMWTNISKVPWDEYDPVWLK